MPLASMSRALATGKRPTTRQAAWEDPGASPSLEIDTVWGTRLRRPLKSTSSSSKDEIAARDLLCHVVNFFNSRGRDSDATASHAPAPVECYGIRQTPAAVCLPVARERPGAFRSQGPHRAAVHPRRTPEGTVQEHTGTTAESFPNKMLLETPVLVELSALSLSGRMDPKDSASQGLVGEKGEAGTGVRRVAMQARTDLDRWLVTSHGVSLERNWLKASRCLPLPLMIAIFRARLGTGVLNIAVEAIIPARWQA
ncbi:hypothetical protein CSOJ01_07839 [Colletotrichum sojae]|uniref:Uncharacterized protein n=1 Tax=Colletotrichum sojae TaxID=2175907 RepID=A0A8H6J7J3_9PEZI|nr:hypothetical protein CSOJ01_07839 [Colletotrichum sojae]